MKRHCKRWVGAIAASLLAGSAEAADALKPTVSTPTTEFAVAASTPPAIPPAVPISVTPVAPVSVPAAIPAIAEVVGFSPYFGYYPTQWRTFPTGFATTHDLVAVPISPPRIVPPTIVEAPPFSPAQPRISVWPVEPPDVLTAVRAPFLRQPLPLPMAPIPAVEKAPLSFATLGKPSLAAPTEGTTTAIASSGPAVPDDETIRPAWPLLLPVPKK